MKTSRIRKESLELLGMLMIGEGVVGLIYPIRYSLFRKMGPHWLRRVAGAFAAHPAAMRFTCAGEIAAGVWLAAHQLKSR